MTDSVERRISDLDKARTVMREHMAGHLHLLEQWYEQNIVHFGASCRKFALRTLDAIIVSLARIVVRNGSASPLHRHYHDELHPFDLLERLQRMHDFSPGSLSPEDFFTMAMFCAAHDLRQDETGYDADGVGLNERASAEEFGRIMDLAGFDRSQDAMLYSQAREMIHGTTFYTDAYTYNGKSYPGGALAPALADSIAESEDGIGDRVPDNTDARLILMATDIDTANVADPFLVFIDRAVRLCREIQNVAGRPELDSSVALDVYRFCTDMQEQYFLDLQRFYTEESENCFQTGKAANSPKLKAVIQAMRNRFGGLLVNADHGIDGEEVLHAFMQFSREQEARSSQ